MFYSISNVVHSPNVNNRIQGRRQGHKQQGDHICHIQFRVIFKNKKSCDYKKRQVTDIENS